MALRHQRFRSSGKTIDAECWSMRKNLCKLQIAVDEAVHSHMTVKPRLTSHSLAFAEDRLQFIHQPIAQASRLSLDDEYLKAMHWQGYIAVASA